MLAQASQSSKLMGVPLYLNVYDLTPINGYLYWFGLGIYHSAVEAYGVEYAFGAHDYPSSGVFEVEPRSCPGFTFRRTVLLGYTQLSSDEFRQFMVRVASEYNGDTYHLIVKNCNHFCDDVSTRLTGSAIPGWVNRLAKLGSLCKCLLPDSLQINTIRQTPEYHEFEELEFPSHEENTVVHDQRQDQSKIVAEEELELLFVPGKTSLVDGAVQGTPLKPMKMCA